MPRRSFVTLAAAASLLGLLLLHPACSSDGRAGAEEQVVDVEAVLAPCDGDCRVRMPSTADLVRQR